MRLRVRLLLSFLLGLKSVSGYAQISPDYTESVGGWNIVGVVSKAGNMISCKMQKQTALGTPFAFITFLGFGAGEITTKAFFMAPTSFPDGSSAEVSLTFSKGGSFSLNAIVKGGYLLSELGDNDLSRNQNILSLLQNSRTLTEVAHLLGQPSETILLDLSGSKKAFDENGICMRTTMYIGIERVKKGTEH